MGCRSCMIACPFDIPKFEYDSPNPKIQKCRMCFELLQDGQKPKCAENCPAEALLFGKRRDLIEIAKARIYDDPENDDPEERYPYSRLDVAFIYRHSIKSYHFEVGISILNVLNHENIKYSNVIRIPVKFVALSL